MRYVIVFENGIIGPVLRWVVFAFAFLGVAATSASAQETGSTSYDGLVVVEDAKVDAAWIDPDADFSVFTRVAILDPVVSFRSNWQRDQNRSRRGSSRISSSDVERIKRDVAALFKEVFTERLEADDGYEVVSFADYDVLLLRPAIIDLDIADPEVATAGRSQSYSASTGAATLYLELFDSVSGEILGRAVDRQSGRRSAPGTLMWSGRMRNVAEARRIFGDWADQLRSFLDQYYTE